MNRTFRGVVAALAAGVMLAGCGGPKVIARVNKDKITDEEFYSRMAQVDAAELMGSAQTRGPARAGEYAMRFLIVEKLILQLAAEKGASPTDAQIKEYLAFARRYPQAAGASPYRTEEMAQRDARLQVAMRNLMAKPLNISEADIQAEYEKLRPQLVEPKQYRLRIIEVSSEEKAKAAAEKLRKGISFETVALTDSDDPSLRARSGDTGFLPEAAMPASLRDVLKRLKPGEYTKDPVKLEAPRVQGQPTGAPPHWFLVQVVEIKEARQIPLADVRYDIVGRAIASKDPAAAERVMALLRDYARKAKIEVTLKGYEEVAKQIKDSAAAPMPAAPQPSAAPQTPSGQPSQSPPGTNP